MKYRINIILILLVLFLMPFTIKAENVYRGSGDKQSITDIMGNYAEGDYTTPDEKVMKETTPYIQNIAGTVISVIIILLFAVQVFLTACDLAYIGVPSLRSTLYDNVSNSNLNNSNLNGMNQMGMNQMGINQRGMNQIGMNPRGMNQMGMNQRRTNSSHRNRNSNNRGYY